MKREATFFAGGLIVWMLLGYSCKHQVFLKQKYVHGNLGASTHVTHTKSFVKKNEADVIHPMAPATSIDEDDKLAATILTASPALQKTLVKNRVARKMPHAGLLHYPSQAIPYTAKLLKTAKAVKPEDNGSKGSHIFKVVLLTVLFWVVMGMLYSRTLLAVEVASMAVTFQILACVLLAVIVWLIIYYLFRVFGKNAIKS